MNVQRILQGYGAVGCTSEISISISDVSEKYFGTAKNEKLVDDCPQVEVDEVNPEIERKRKIEYEIVPEGKRYLTDEFETQKQNSNVIQKKSYKSNFHLL